MKKTTRALDILRRRYVGDDKGKQAELRNERINAEVAGRIHTARKEAGLSQKELAGLVKTTQSVISRLEDSDYGGHSLKMLQRVGAALGRNLQISFDADGTIAPGESTQQVDDQGIAELIDQCPVGEMQRRDWLPPGRTVADFRRSLLAFLGPAPCLTPAHFRLSNPSEANQVALTCWLTKVEIEAERVTLGRFTARRLKAELAELAGLSARNDGPVLAVQWLEARGLPCVFVRHLQKTYLDGGAMLLDDGRPAIALTLRKDRLDNFWFTLLHEIAHVLLHRKELAENPIVDEDIERPCDDALENEADRFAESAWVEPVAWRAFRKRVRKYIRLADVDRFAAQLGVSPALVAGRLRYELRRWSHYRRFLRQGTVRAAIQKAYPVF